MLFKNFELFIFDMDGILVDTERIFIEDIIIESKKIGYDVKKEILLNNLGNTNEKSSIYMKKIYGENYNYNNLAIFVDNLHMEKAKKKLIPLKKGVKEILVLLKSKNKKIAVASSSNYERMKIFLESTKIYDYFYYIISGENLKESKPNPEIFLSVMDYFNLDFSKTVVFEDSLNGLKAAKKSKAFTVFIPDIIGVNKENYNYFDIKYDDFYEVIKDMDI